MTRCTGSYATHVGVTWALLFIINAVHYCESEILRTPVAVYPGHDAVTAVNLSITAQRVRIPLEHESKHAPLYLEYTARLYSLNGSSPTLPGPTIHVIPGGTLKINFTNTLGTELLKSSPAHMFTYHAANYSNLHFHGVHGNPAVDDPFVSVAPGQGHLYVLPILDDHLPGLHWYHTHYHGSVYYQVMGGLFGALTVMDPKSSHNDNNNDNSNNSEASRANGTLLQENWPSHLLLIHLYRLGASSGCDGDTMDGMDAVMHTSLPFDAQIIDSHGRKHKMSMQNVFLINGQHRPTIVADRGEAAWLRLGYAAGSCFVNLSLPHACEFHVTAYDGVSLPRSESIKHHWLYLTTATRVDVAMVCHTAGVFPVKLLNDHNRTLFYLRVNDNANHAAKENHGTKKAHTVHFPLQTSSPSKAGYLNLKSDSHVAHDISLSQKDTEGTKPRPYYLLGHGSDCRSLHSSSTCRYEHFSGAKGDRTDLYDGFVVGEGSVVTARLFGDPTDRMNHPFHFHVNHFRVVSFVPRAGGHHENETLEMYGVTTDQYRDTIPVLDGVTTIQWRASTYTGEIVYHCHNLGHEDRGMMTSYLVYNKSSAHTRLGAYDDGSNHRSGEGSEGSPSSETQNEPSVAPVQSQIAYIVLVGAFIASCAIAAVYHCLQLLRDSNEEERSEPNRMSSDAQAVMLTEHSPLLPRSHETAMQGSH